MFHLTPDQFMTLAAEIILILGALTFLTGFVLLLRQAFSRTIETIAAQTATMAQKGMAEDLVGLVGNAKSLVDALNQLVRTSAGIGLFLIVFGSLLMLAAFILGRQIPVAIP